MDFVPLHRIGVKPSTARLLENLAAQRGISVGQLIGDLVQAESDRAEKAAFATEPPTFEIKR